MQIKHYTTDSINDLKTFLKQSNQIKDYFLKASFDCPQDLSLVSRDSELSVDEDVFEKMLKAYKPKAEFEAGKVLFESFRISPKQASDIGMWTYLNLHQGYQYVAQRWPGFWKKEDTKSYYSNNYILNHWIQTNATQGELIDYPLSGLWWSFWLTVDESRNDKYELTKMFFENATMRTKQLGQANFAGHKPAMLAVLEFMKESGFDKSNRLEEATRAIVPFVNRLGGIRPLTYFDKEWFKMKLYEEFSSNIQNNKKLFARPGESWDLPQNKIIKSNLVDENDPTCHSSEGIKVFFTDKGNAFFYDQGNINDGGSIIYSTTLENFEKGHFYFGFADGNLAKIPASSYRPNETRNRNKLTNAFSTKSTLMFIEFSTIELDLVYISKNQKCVIMNSSLINSKETRVASGAGVIKLKANDQLAGIFKTKDLKIAYQDIKYYRKESRAVGFYLKPEHRAKFNEIVKKEAHSSSAKYKPGDTLDFDF